MNTGSVVVAAAAAFTAQWGFPNYNYCLVTNDSGSTSIGAGDALQIGGGNYNINAGATFTGPSGASLTLGGTVVVGSSPVTLPMTVNLKRRALRQRLGLR